MGRHALALEHFNEQIAANPDDYLQYVGRGAYFKRIQRYDAALQDYSAAIEKAKATDVVPPVSVYTERSDLYATAGDLDLAIQDATTAIDITNATDDYSFQCRARIHWQAGRVELALADYDMAVGLDPDDGYSHYYRAQALHNLMRYKDALEEYSFIIDNKMMPEGFDWLPLRWRAEVLAQLQQYEQAVADLDAVLITHPTKQDVLERRKQIAEHAGIKDPAIPGMLEL